MTRECLMSQRQLAAGPLGHFSDSRVFESVLKEKAYNKALTDFKGNMSYGKILEVTRLRVLCHHLETM